MRVFALGVGAAGAVLLAGGPSVPVVFLALVAGLTFGDLARRGVAERDDARVDPTDLAMSGAFLLILVVASRDLGADVARGWPGLTDLARMALGSVGIAAGVVLRQRVASALGAHFHVRLGVREGQGLVRGGPFEWVRHPSYASLLAIALGTSVAIGSVAAAVVALGVWLPVVLWRIRREEGLLEQRFADEYRAYRASTWALVPGLY